MRNITDYKPEINSAPKHPVCNCGRIDNTYPTRDYEAFWLKEPDGQAVLYSIYDIDTEDPYGAIEDIIQSGTFFDTKRRVGGAPVFILVTLKGDE